jgi:predicted RNA methylase
VFKEYQPPSARMRLRNAEGKELRHNAEKSILINEYLVDLFTSKNGVVFDMFAGTGSMAVACIKTERYYVGCEPDGDVHTWATQRIGRAWAALDRGELTANQAGVRRTVAEQVHTRGILRNK